MKKTVCVVLAVVVLSAICTIGKGADVVKDAKAGNQVVRHVVLFAYKSGTTPEQIKDIEKRFLDLKNKIGGILELEGGPDISTEKKAQGFTHCFIVTFKDVAARDAYLPHPAHQEFGKSLGPCLDKVLVIDFLR